jgi:probable rRNA maturation factor
VRVHLVGVGARHSIPAHLLAKVGVAAMRATRCPARAEVEVALVDDATIARLNRRFLGHRRPTDVLTFPAGSGGPSRVIGEIVISVERARDQARRYRHPVRREVALLFAHGVLHLLGDRDDTPKAAARMLARAQGIVTRVFGARARGSRGRRARGAGR